MEMTTQLHKESTIDLLAELEKATEEKIEVSTDDTAFNDEAIETLVDDFNMHDLADDFSEDMPIAPNAEEQEDVKYDAEELTDFFLDGADMLMSNMFPALYKKSLKKEDKDALAALAEKYRSQRKGVELNLSDDDLKVMSIYNDFEEYEKDLPLTTAEKANIRKPLKKVLRKMDFNVTPESALLMAVAMMLLPRLVPIVMNKIK